MEPDLIALATQFGMAGLIAWMWLSERRGAGEREARLGEAHERLMDQRVQLDALLGALGDNTRAITALEASQRSIARLVEDLAQPDRSRPSPVDSA